MQKQKISLKFHHDKDADIALKTYQYDTSMKIKDMLYDFLRQTNSKMTLDTNQISFMYGGLLNNDKNLEKTVGEIFKKKNNQNIKIFDTGDVIGGVLL